MKPYMALVGALLATVAFSVETGEQPRPEAQQKMPGRARFGQQVEADYGKIPLYFIPNQGQLDKQVAYYVQGKDKTIYFASGGVTFVPTGKDRPSRWAVKLEFVGADKTVRPTGKSETGAVVSYFKGRPEDWHVGLPTYSKVIYPNLWSGIDLVYYGTVDRLKYELIVHPGADPSKIRLAYRGASAVEVNSEGRLEVKTPAGDFADDRPVGYQEINGRRVEVALRYSLEKRPANGAMTCVYGFGVGDYDRTKPLILDPAFLIYCGFIGGGSRDQGYGIAVDASGNAYIAGTTGSTESTFPVNVGPDVTVNGGGADAFVAKINAAGTALIYCGYIGGEYSDDGRAIAVDPAGNAYVTGITWSDAFPVTIGPDLTFNGGAYDAFVAKINASGTALDYCGYIGGSSFEEAYAIAVDESGSAYVTGYTESTESSFPVIVGPDLTYNNGDGYNDAFVAKINPAGTGLSYCGYIGGSSLDYGYGIAVDKSGNAYVTGYTQSPESSFPVTGGPDLSFNGVADAFVAKVNAGGTGLSYCGFIGGDGEEGGNGIALDGAGNSYVTGGTYSTETTFPVKVGPDLTFNNTWGFTDAFVVKVNAAGTALDYCGYIGGSNFDWGTGIAVDGSGCAHVVGQTSSTESTFPVTAGPDLTFGGGAEDTFVAKVEAAGRSLVYCGYLSGSGADYGFGIDVDGAGNAYIAGTTDSTEATFPVTVGPDLTYNDSSGWDDVFVAKVHYFDERIPKHGVGDFDGDGIEEIAVDFGPAGIWTWNWTWNVGRWTLLNTSDPENIAILNVDGNNDDEILLDLGPSGLWYFDGIWYQVIAIDVEAFSAGDMDADGRDEVVADLGPPGLWLLSHNPWSQLSGASPEYITMADIFGSGAAEIICDYGAIGLWAWSAGTWTMLSGVNPDYVIPGKSPGSSYLVGDFGATGLWRWSISGGWVQLSGVNADHVITPDIDGDAAAEIVGDFGSAGLWSCDGGIWTQLSGANAVFMAQADVDGDGQDEVCADFGSIGLWLWDGGAWSQISGTIAEYMFAGDVDGDSKDELLADFGVLGLWMWNEGIWSQIKADNPD